MHPETIPLSRLDTGHKAVPDESRALLKREAVRLIVLCVEETYLDSSSVFRIDGEIGALTIPPSAEGVRFSGQKRSCHGSFLS
jgi:hypothetical protein